VIFLFTFWIGNALESADENVYNSEKERHMGFKKKTVFKIWLPWEIHVVYFWDINVNRFWSQLMKMFTTAKRSAISSLRKKLFSKMDYLEKYMSFTFGLLM
jgi:hypothetical protein